MESSNLLHLEVWLQHTAQLSYAKKLISPATAPPINISTPIPASDVVSAALVDTTTIPGLAFVNTLNSCQLFVDSTLEKQTSSDCSSLKIFVSKLGIESTIEYAVKTSEDESQQVTELIVTFPPSQVLFKGNKWEPVDKEWENMQIQLSFELLDVAGPAAAPEEFLPSPLYHFLLDLLPNDSQLSSRSPSTSQSQLHSSSEVVSHQPLAPLQVGLIKSALLTLRFGNTNELPFYNDAVLSNVCRDLLLPFAHSSVLTTAQLLSNTLKLSSTSIADTQKRLAVSQPHKVIFHGPSGCGKTRIAQFIAEKCGYRCVYFGSPTQLVQSYDGVFDKFECEFSKRLSCFRNIPALFVLEGVETKVPPFGNFSLLVHFLAKYPNVLFIATTNKLQSLDKVLFQSGRKTLIYFNRPAAAHRIHILSHSFASRGFKNAAAALAAVLPPSTMKRLHVLLCGRTAAYTIALADACIRRSALDDQSYADPTWAFVLPRLERASRDLLFSEDDPDELEWTAEPLLPPEEWNGVMLGVDKERRVSGRAMCDAESGKMLVEYEYGVVHPMWYAAPIRGPCVAQQIALGLAATLVEPNTVMVIDSRRAELVKGDSECGEGFAALLAEARHAGSRGGALLVFDVDDLVGLVKDSSSKSVMHLHKYVQDPMHRFDSTKLLREHVMHRIVSFSNLASFVKDFSEKSFCIVVAVVRDPFVRDRLANAWHLDVPLTFESSFYPKGLRVSPSILSTAEDEDDAAGCVCGQLQVLTGESFLWVVQVFLTHGSVSLGVVHSSVNTLTNRFLSGVVGDDLGSWGFRITPTCVEVCQPTSIPGKGLILTPLPEAHENPTRATIRNNRSVFGIYLQAHSSGYKLHLLRFLNLQENCITRRWEHVAYKRIENLEGLVLIPTFGLSKRATSVNILSCNRVPANWLPTEALPDTTYASAFVPSLRSPSSVSLWKGGFHLSSTNVFLDKLRITSGKKALIRFHVQDKAPQFVVGFVKESDMTNVHLTSQYIYGYNPSLALCVGPDHTRHIPSLTENVQKTGYLYIDLCPASPYYGSVHYFRQRILGNMVYCGSVIEGLPNEAYRAAISFEDPSSDQGKLLGTLGTPKLGAGLGRECLPIYVYEWYPLDYSIPQGSMSFSPDPNTFRQEKDGMNSRFTRELTPQSADWHYIECRVNSCTGSALVILGFVPSQDFASTRQSHVGTRGTPGFGYSVHNSEVHLGNSGVSRSSTKFSSSPKDYVRVGLLLSLKLGEVHLFWAEVGAPGPVDYKGLLFENVPDRNYRFVISAGHAGTTVSWRGFACNGSLPQAKAHVQARNLEFHELDGNVAYASRNYVMFPGLDIIGDDISLVTNASPHQLRDHTDKIGAGAFTSLGAIKDYSKIYQRMRVVSNRVEIAGLNGPVCSDFCLRIHIDGYVFVPRHDAMGDSVQADTGDLLGIAQQCTLDANAVAFNTGGYIKHSLKTWAVYTTDPEASGCFSGIFIKESFVCRWLGTTDPKHCLSAIRSLVAETRPPAAASSDRVVWAIN